MKSVFQQVCDKKYNIIINGYNPNYVILWTGYVNGLTAWSQYGYSSKGVLLKFVGLNVIWTDIPETIEVY